MNPLNRRQFMARVLAGGAAAVAGSALPTDLRPDDIAVLREKGLMVDTVHPEHAYTVLTPKGPGAYHLDIYGVDPQEIADVHVKIDNHTTRDAYVTAIIRFNSGQQRAILPGEYS